MSSIVRLTAVAALGGAGTIAVVPAAPPPVLDIQVPAIALSAEAGSDVEVGALPDLEAIQAELASAVNTVATVTVAAGVGLSGLAATPFALLGLAVTSVGAAVTDLGGLFVPVGTAVLDVGGLPGLAAELISASGVSLTQGLVTPVYDALINLLSGGSNPGAAPDFSQPLLDPVTAF